MARTAEAIWWESPKYPGRELRAHAANGSVDLLAGTVPEVLAAIKARGGRVTRTQTVQLGPVATLAGADAVCQAAGKAYMVFGLDHESRWHYSEALSGRKSRSMALKNPHILDLWTDCSGAVVLSHKVAGFEDPAGQKYAGVGNSTEICAHLRPVALSQIGVCDVVTFGVNGEDHAAEVFDVSAHGGVTLWSHGQEAGPLLITLESEHRAHGSGPVQFRRRGLPVAA